MLQTGKLVWLGFKLICRILFVASPIVVLIVVIVSIITDASSTETHMTQAREILRVLKNSEIKSVALLPSAGSSSLVHDTVIIKDVATISRLVTDFSTLDQYKPGRGRLPGSWQVQVTFLLNNGSMIDSYVYHNDFSDMVFIPTQEMNVGLGLQSYFATDRHQNISKVLQKYR
ncbi:hypothetical protein [Hymenobacter sediminis]|uniref:hypothetical protein n=1 Tax=Hymenobacter sediminis TaxID=2218621 RepID=UPI000DA6DA9C|nr:hypothetical protein [Hymenobacter sediminis]